MALGIAASKAAGLRQNFGTMTKPLHAGEAARNGVEAAQLAQRGFTANPQILEERFGFFNTFAGAGEFVPETVLQDFGAPFEIVSPGIGVKPYPACRQTHRGIDAMLELVHTQQFQPDEVSEIICETSARMLDFLIYHRPRTGLEGKFSMNFCVAAALSEGQVGLETFEDAYVRSSGIQELLPRIVLRVNPSLGKNAPALTQAIVTIRLAGGQVLRHEANGARGYPEHPPSAEELGTKFRSCALKALPKGLAESTLSCLNSLETLSDVRILTRQLAVEKVLAADFAEER